MLRWITNRSVGYDIAYTPQRGKWQPLPNHGATNFNQELTMTAVTRIFQFIVASFLGRAEEFSRAV